MLILSREALGKIGRHAWNVYPLEAFGYLLGRTESVQIFAALPCTKTLRWNGYADRWTRISEHLDVAQNTAARFDLEIVGFYGSTAQFEVDSYPRPPVLDASMGLLLIYRNICCPSCSWFSLHQNGQKILTANTPFPKASVQATPSINAHAWREVHTIDYTNGNTPQP